MDCPCVAGPIPCCWTHPVLLDCSCVAGLPGLLGSIRYSQARLSGGDWWNTGPLRMIGSRNQRRCGSNSATSGAAVFSLLPFTVLPFTVGIGWVLRPGEPGV